MHRLLKGAFLALALAGAVLTGCGGGSSGDEENTGRARRKRAKMGGKLTMLWTDDVDNIDPGITLLPDGLHGRLRHAAAAVLVEARRRRDAGAGPRRVRPADLRGRQDRHREDPHRRQVQPAGRPRGDVQGRQVRDRARLLQHRPERLRGRLLRRPRRRQARRRARHEDRRHRDAGRPDDRLQAQARHRAACWRARWRSRSAPRCRRSTRASSTPSSRRCTARTRSRPART